MHENLLATQVEPVQATVVLVGHTDKSIVQLASLHTLEPHVVEVLHFLVELLLPEVIT